MGSSERSQKIAELNDQFRSSMGVQMPGQPLIPGHVVLTQGVAALSQEVQFSILEQVRGFNVFTSDNDPWGEHDFGIIPVEEVRSVYWKIDYYAPDLVHGSENPADLEVTVRVLTVLLASEY